MILNGCQIISKLYPQTLRELLVRAASVGIHNTVGENQIV